MFDTSEKVTHFAHEALLQIEMMEGQSLLVRDAAAVEMVKLKQAIEGNQAPPRRQISFQESRFHEGRLMAAFIAKTYARAARDSGQPEDAKRAMQKLEDLADWCNVERARTRRARIKASQQSRRRAKSDTPAAKPPTESAEWAPSVSDDDTDETDDLELSPEMQALQVRTNATMATQDWIRAVRQWGDAGGIGPAPSYPEDVLKELRAHAPRDTEVAVYLAKIESYVRRMDAASRSVGVSAPLPA